MTHCMYWVFRSDRIYNCQKHALVKKFLGALDDIELSFYWLSVKTTSLYKVCFSCKIAFCCLASDRATLIGYCLIHFAWIKIVDFLAHGLICNRLHKHCIDSRRCGFVFWEIDAISALCNEIVVFLRLVLILSKFAMLWFQQPAAT